MSFMDITVPYSRGNGEWVIAIDPTGGKPDWEWNGHDRYVVYCSNSKEIYQENCAGACMRPWEQWEGLTNEMRAMIEMINKEVANAS